MNDPVEPIKNKSLLLAHWDMMQKQMEDVNLISPVTEVPALQSKEPTIAQMENAIKSLTKGSSNMSSPALLDKKNLRTVCMKSPDFTPGKTLFMDTYGKVKLYLDKKTDILLVADYPLTLTSRGVMPIAKDVWTNWQVYANTLQNSERHMEEIQESKSISSNSSEAVANWDKLYTNEDDDIEDEDY